MNRITPKPPRDSFRSSASPQLPPAAPSLAELPTESADGTSLRFAWIILLAVPVWLLFYWSPDDPSRTRTLWLLYAAIVGVEGLRTALVYRRPAHVAHLIFPFFDALAISLAVRWTGGINSELWLFYPFQLVAGAFDPNPRTIRVLSGLVALSYAGAILPDVNPEGWADFLHHLHIPAATLHALTLADAPPNSANAIAPFVTRLFFLFVVGGMAHAIAQKRRRQERELAELREQVAVAEDRGRIARELHDSLNHTIVGSLLRLEMVSRLLRNDPDEAAQLLGEEKSALRNALDSVRDYVFHLRPAELEREPLVPLLEGYARRFAERTGIVVEVKAEAGGEPRPALRVVAARVAQEAMTNAAKHAGATRILVEVQRESGGWLRVRITDDGQGFDPASPRSGIGLSCMRERVEALGGRLEIDSREGQGTTISAYLPLK